MQIRLDHRIACELNSYLISSGKWFGGGVVVVMEVGMGRVIHANVLCAIQTVW